MWSHYADGHKGLCIEFSASNESYLDFFGRAHPVDYQSDLPVLNFYTDHPLDKVQKYLLTKAIDWSYEKEYRIIEKNRNRKQYHDFDPILIRRVFLGSCISEKHIQSVQSFVDEIPSNVRPMLLQAQRSPLAYSLEFEPIR